MQFLPENFTVILFHYDGNVDGWHGLRWSNSVIHIAAPNQTKWWGFKVLRFYSLQNLKNFVYYEFEYNLLLYLCQNFLLNFFWHQYYWTFQLHSRWFAKRFLHPDVVSTYDYIFLWDEDLGVENFHPGRYVLVAWA